MEPVEDPYTVRDGALEVPTVASPPTPRRGAPRRGRRLKVEAGDGSGHYVRSRPAIGPIRDLALDATLRTAALRGATQLPAVSPSTEVGEPAAGMAGPGHPGVGEGGVGKAGGEEGGNGDAPSAVEAQGHPGIDLRGRLRRSDLREKVRVRRAGSALAFVVDASGSMRSQRRMVEAKTAVLSLLQSAYTHRDRVALVAFGGNQARLLLPFTASVELARRHLAALPSGGKTPLGEGLRMGLELVLEERRRQPGALPLMVAISDGKPNWSRTGDPVAEAERVAWQMRRHRIPLLFLDTDPTWQEPGIGQSLARITRGRYLPLADLQAGAIVSAVTGALA